MAKGKNYLGGGFGTQPQRQPSGGNQMEKKRQSQRMQEELSRSREELEAQTYEATAGGGMVRAVVNGKKELIALEIAPEVMAPDNVEIVQDMVIAAINEALRTSKRMRAMADGLNMTPLTRPER